MQRSATNMSKFSVNTEDEVFRNEGKWRSEDDTRRAVSWAEEEGSRSRRRKDDEEESTPRNTRSQSVYFTLGANSEPWSRNFEHRGSMSSIYSSSHFHHRYRHERRPRRPSSVDRENHQLLFGYLNADPSLRMLIGDLSISPSDVTQGESPDLAPDELHTEGSFRLEEHIKLHHLQKLLEVFKAHIPESHMTGTDDGKTHPAKDEEHGSDQVEQSPGMMTLEEFTATISSMLGSNRWADQMESLFHKVDTACDGYVDWDELCTYMLLRMRELEHVQNTKLIPFTTPPTIKQIFHNKQETTTRAFVVENPSRIVTVSKVGSIGIWANDLRLIRTYNLANDVSEEQQQPKRRFHTWVTDAVYMRNTQNFALTTSSREIYFYDISTSIYSIEYCLYALPNVPICAYYHYNRAQRNGLSKLFFGDDTGSAHVLYFHTPVSRLFQKPFSPQQGTQRVYFNELREHRQFVTYKSLENIHEDAINRIMYVPESDVIISSSLSPSTSVVMMDMGGKNKPYIFRVNKGVECFDYSKSLSVLVTGSLDHLVRIWNPYVTAKPIKILRGHNTGICDVVINRAYNQIVSYSKEVVLKVWDVKEHTCLQTISPKFPSVPPGRIPDHGEFPLCLYQATHDMLLLSCNDCIALYPMGKLEATAELPTTHNSPLCGCIYNPLFNQVVTASDDSTVSVWDVETGVKSLTFSNAHGQEEITCIAFDDRFRRLFTGARDGSIKVWNFQNGNCLHELEAIGEAEVTGVISFHDRTILAVGWSRKIALYDDSDPDIVTRKASLQWKGGQMHEDDILTVAHCPPNLLATGSYDGCIYVWNEETQQIFLQLRDPKAEMTSVRSNRPIDNLMFLRDRFRQSSKNQQAVLVSSESGWLYWWCLFGHTHLLGQFRAASSDDHSVLAMTAVNADRYLVTADTSGHVTVWEVQHFCTGDVTSNHTFVAPPLIHHWRAHEGAVVQVDSVERDDVIMILTSSSDKMARLWTLEGRLVGTFGQRCKWDVKRPKTYVHPQDVWGEVVGDPGHQVKFPDVEAVNGGETEQVNHEAPPVPENSDDDVIPDSSSDVADEALQIRIHAPDMDDEDRERACDELTNRKQKTSDQSEDEGAQIVTGLVEKKHSEKRKILGVLAEERLSRRTTTRSERRCRVGYIDGKTTSRFGNLCSPFQALTIKETHTVSFDDEMPMTKRMMEKGMKCSTEADLDRMPLSNLHEFGDVTCARSTQRHRRHPPPRSRHVERLASRASSATPTDPSSNQRSPHDGLSTPSGDSHAE